MKKTMYEPIPVSSGELPEREGKVYEWKVLSKEVTGIYDDGRMRPCYYDFNCRNWKSLLGGYNVTVVSWLKEIIIDMPDDKEPVYPNEAVIGVKFEDRVEVPWEDNMK